MDYEKWIFKIHEVLAGSLVYLILWSDKYNYFRKEICVLKDWENEFKMCFHNQLRLFTERLSFCNPFSPCKICCFYLHNKKEKEHKPSSRGLIKCRFWGRPISSSSWTISGLLWSLKSSLITKPALLNSLMSPPVGRLGAQLAVGLGRTSSTHHVLASSLSLEKSKTVHSDRPFYMQDWKITYLAFPSPSTWFHWETMRKILWK